MTRDEGDAARAETSRREMHVQSPWTDASHRRWLSAGRPDLVYHAAMDSDLAWLPEVAPFGVNVVGTIDDDTAVQHCSSLERLALNTDCTRSLDLSGLQRLLAFGGADRFRRGLLLPQTLRELDLRGWTRTDLADLAHLPSLTSLTLQGRRLDSLTGLEAVHLSRLTIRDAGRLHRLQPLASQAACLIRLDLTGCRKLHDLESVARLKSLRVLLLRNCGEIASVRPLLSLPDLEVVALDGNTTIADADVAALARKPGLRWLTVERLHPTYNATREMLPRDETVAFD